MPIDPELLKNQRKIYEKYYPEFLEELRGTAAGGGFDPDSAIASAITGELFFFRNMMGMGRACTIFGCKQGGQLLVGRNYDWMPLPKDLFEVYRVNNSQRYAYFAATDYGIVDPTMSAPQYRSYLPEDVINDQGLFVGITFSFVDQWANRHFQHPPGQAAGRDLRLAGRGSGPVRTRAGMLPQEFLYRGPLREHGRGRAWREEVQGGLSARMAS